jgi:hypothetical protein
MISNSANLFVDRCAPFHKPPFQAYDGLAIAPEVITVMDLMNDATQCGPPLTCTTQGTGASTYLTSVNGVAYDQDSNRYYWVYFLNGLMPTVGFKAFVLNNNDSVAWDYKHFSSGLRQSNHLDHPANK